MKRTALKTATKGLVGAVALAGGSQAYGNVVSVAGPADIIPTSGTTAATFRDWDVNGDGANDLSFGFQQASVGGNFVGGVIGLDTQSLPVAYYGAYAIYANRLTLGTTVGPTNTFLDSYPYFTVLGSRFSGTFYGQFTSSTGAPVRGFMGFEFAAADGIHYGAIELQTSPYVDAANPGGLRFFGAQYETVPGQALTIAAAVPEPTSLAALAFGAAGAAGVAMRRRQRARQESARA